MIGRYVDRIFGVDRWFFFKVGVRSKWRRLRCVLLGGHTHEWTPLLGSGRGQDALICKRCFCHVIGYRATQGKESNDG